jgi:hypothetical protein
LLSSKKNPRGISGKTKAVTIEIPGVLLAGGLARRRAAATNRCGRSAAAPFWSA